MASILPAALSWATPFLAYLPPLDLDVGAFCALEPPDIPSGAELLAAAGTITTGNPLTKAASVLVFSQLLKAFIWYHLCTCKIDATPPAPAPPAAPTGLPVINPPSIVSLPSALPCSVTGPQGLTASPGSGPTFIAQGSRVAFFGGPLLNVTSTRVTLKNTVHTSPGVNVLYRIVFSYVDGAVSVPYDHTFELTPSQTLQIDLPWPLDATDVKAHVSGGSGSGSTDYLVTFEQFCAGSECCGPDTTSLSLLNSILQTVTLLQRQIAPFAYIEGTVHSTLTGTGSFVVQGLLGLRIQITTLPDYVGHLVATPTRVFDVGFVDVGDDSGYILHQELQSVSQLWFPPEMGLMTIVSYSLEPNVVLRITELVREP